MAFLDSLINGASDAILVADIKTGDIVFANPAAYKLFECDENYLIGKHQTQLHPPEELEFIKKKFEEFISSSNYNETRAVILMQLGNKKSVLITSANLFESEGKMFSAAYFKDISHLDRLDEIAFEQSHIVRAPLANILGVTDLLLEGGLPEDKNKQLLEALQGEIIKFDAAIKRISKKAFL